MESVSALRRAREVREKYDYLERMVKAEAHALHDQLAEATISDSPSQKPISVDEDKHGSTPMQAEVTPRRSTRDVSQQQVAGGEGENETETNDDATAAAAVAESFRRSDTGMNRRRSIAALEASTVMPRRRPVPLVARHSLAKTSTTCGETLSGEDQYRLWRDNLWRRPVPLVARHSLASCVESSDNNNAV